MSEASPMLEGGPPPLAAYPGDALPEGTRLAEFEVRRVLGAGGFGIVYLAWDHALEREVALKEYMPVTLAGRGPGLRVSIRTPAHEDTFALGLRSFVNEARLLARFDHPSLVKVYRFWEDNGTAYMAMPMYHGRTLRQVRQAMAPGSPGEAWCRALMEPMLGALERLHREEVYHRDVAPDNIVLTEEGQAVLLDFGAARRVIGDRTHALTAILKPHFAPIEQYADTAAVRQGPWTDLYGLAATVYYLLTAQAPLPAAARALHDELPSLAQLQPAGCSAAFLQAVDWAMAVRPQERPQSVAQWRDALEGRITVPARPATPSGAAATAAPTAPTGGGFDPTVALASAPAAARAAGAAGHVASVQALWRGITLPRGLAALMPSAAEAPTDAPLPARRRQWALAALAGLALAGLLGAFAWVLPSPRPAARPVAAASAPTAAGAPADAPADETAAPPTGTLAGTPTVTPVAAGPATTIEPGAGALPASAALPEPAAPAPRERSRDRDRRQGAPAHAVAVPGPLERCGDRMFLTRLICMKRECDRDPRLRSHPECVRLQKAEQERRERMQEH